MKNRYFSNAPRNHKLKSVKITLCVMIVLYIYIVLFKKVYLKWVGGTGGKIELTVEKWSFSLGLSREFSRMSLTHNNTLFYTFSDQIHSPQSLKTPKKF